MQIFTCKISTLCYLYIFDHINTSSSFNFRFAAEDWIVVAVPKFEVVEVAVYGQVGYGVSNSVVTKNKLDFINSNMQMAEFCELT